MENDKPVSDWIFDNYSQEHWKELEAGKVDKTKSWVGLTDFGRGQKVRIFLDQKEKMKVTADRDQWGLWISFEIDGKGFTVAQEDCTQSFLDSFIAALTVLKDMTIENTPPTIVEYKDGEPCQNLPG